MTASDRPHSLRLTMRLDQRGPLLRRADDDEGGGGLEHGERLGSGTGGPRIRCPKCQWEPRKQDRWQCECLHVWNTFETRGRCPVCAKRWAVTQCLRCHEISAHEDWYEERDAR